MDKQGKKRILISGPLPPPLGGMETYCQDYLETNIPKQFDIIFCRCILLSGVSSAKGWWGLCLRCINRALTLLIWLYMLIVFRPDIVHVHTNSGLGFHARGWMVLWANRLGARSILHMHGGGFKDFYNTQSSVGKKRILRYLNAASILLVLSYKWRQFFESIGVSCDKIVVMPNSVFVPQLTKKFKVNDKLEVLYLSRIEKQKGVYELIEAVAEHPELRRYFRFVIAGPKENEFSQVKAKVESLDLSEIVEMPGPLTGAEKDRAYRNADVYLLPSFAEGMPIGLLEAMSYGLACITTPVGGIPDVIQDYVNGLLIQPGDSGVLATTLKRLAEDVELLRSLGQEARKTVECQYNWSGRANELSELYMKIIS